MQVIVRDNNVDQALRALKKKMQREGIFREMKLRRHFEKPSERKARERAEAVRRMRARGWCVGNMDMTVICERPRMGPRKREVVENLSNILGAPAADLNLKGKTHERVDAVGEGRAIEAHVAVLLVRAR